MNYRPYPDIDRALAQIERGRVPVPPLCPICHHRVDRHATEDGRPVCTHGQGLISCRDCAELWGRDPAIASLINLGRAFGRVPFRHAIGDPLPSLVHPLALSVGGRSIAEAGISREAARMRAETAGQASIEYPRRTGKTAIVRAIVDEAVKAGEHVHVAGRDGTRCAGGDADCALPRIERGDQVVVEHEGRRERYEVADIPVRWRRDSLSLTLRPLDEAAEPDR